MFVPYKIKASAAAVALTLASGSFSSHAALQRVGPVTNDTSLGFFPSWYQDKTGITLEFCAPSPEEMADGFCLLLPGDTIAPESFNTAPGQMNFFDEHFYFASTAAIDAAAADPVTGRPIKALLVLAEEAAFATGAPAAGQQITFSRIRVRLSAAPVAGTYRFIHPYGEESIVAAAGERIFFTDDVGVACAPGTFDCSLNSRLGPFLLPSDVPGGAELPAFTELNQNPDKNDAHFGGAITRTPFPGSGTGKAYIADPARIGPVTGGIAGQNKFRVEGPPGSGLGIDPLTGALVDWVETTNFSLMGRLRNEVIPGDVKIQRASYARNATQAKLDVLAQGNPTTQSRMPGQAPLADARPELSFFAEPCATTTDAVTGAVAYHAPANAAAQLKNMLSIGNQYWGQIQPANLDSMPASVCVRDNTARDVNGSVVLSYVPHPVTDEVTIQAASYDPVAKTLSVQATSSDERVVPTLTLGYHTFGGAPMAGGTITVAGVEAPPHKVSVRSSAKGSNQLDVKTSVTVAVVLPLAPTAVVPALSTTQQRAINVSWTDNSSDETSFEISRATAVGGPYAVVGTVGPGVTSFVDTSAALANNTTYWYRVVALRNTVRSLAAVSVPVSTPLAAAAASGVTPTVISPTRVDIAWTDNANNETSYQVLRSTNGGAFTAISGILPPNSSSYGDTTVVSGTPYRYRVNVSNWTGTVGSANSASVTPQVALNPVTNLAVTPVTGNPPVLSWGDATAGETGDRVRRRTVTLSNAGNRTNGGFATLTTTAADATTFTDTARPANAIVEYEVAPVSGATVGAVRTVLAVPGGIPGVTAAPTFTRVGNTVTINWSQAGTAAADRAAIGGYSVQRCTVTLADTCDVASAGWAQVATVTGRTTVTATNTVNASTPQRTYRYRVISTTGPNAVTTVTGSPSPASANLVR